MVASKEPRLVLVLGLVAVLALVLAVFGVIDHEALCKCGILLHQCTVICTAFSTSSVLIALALLHLMERASEHGMLQLACVAEIGKRI